MANFCAFHGILKFFLKGLGQQDETEEITLRPEILWHYAVYHEANHCITQLMFAFSDLGRARVQSFSERLVFLVVPSCYQTSVFLGTGIHLKKFIWHGNLLKMQFISE